MEVLIKMSREDFFLFIDLMRRNELEHEENKNVKLLEYSIVGTCYPNNFDRILFADGDESLDEPEYPDMCNPVSVGTVKDLLEAWNPLNDIGETLDEPFEESYR